MVTPRITGRKNRVRKKPRAPEALVEQHRDQSPSANWMQVTRTQNTMVRVTASRFWRAAAPLNRNSW